MSLKRIIKYNYDNISRFFIRHYASIWFLLKGSTLRKAMRVRGLKYFKIGKKVSIDSYSRLEVYKVPNITPKLCIEDNVTICFNCTLLVSSNLFIGNNTTIASKVLITTENHSTNPLEGNYCCQPLVTKDVRIGKNCWIGESSIILPGVTIGDFSVIGAGSVVTHNIPDYCLAVGNPARVIKKWNLNTKCWEKVE